MKRILSFVITIIAMLCLLSVTALAADTATVRIAGTLNYSAAEAMLTQLNDYRTANGLKPVVLDRRLTEAAMLRAVESAVYTDHTRPNGGHYRDLIPYRSGTYAENQAWDYSSADSVMTAWKNSAGHNANLLNSKVTHVGLGCATVDGRNYWIQLFFSKGDDNVNDYSSVSYAPFLYDIEILPEYLTHIDTAKDIFLSPGSTTPYIYQLECKYAGKTISVIPAEFSFNGSGFNPCYVRDGFTDIAKLALPTPANYQIEITPLGILGSGRMQLSAYAGDPNPVTLNVRLLIHTHQYGPMEVLVEPTCNRVGTGLRHCTAEGDCTERTIMEPIPKTDHILSDTPSYYKEATCTTQGYSGDYRCTFCRQIVITGELTPMAPHTPSDWIIDERNSTDTSILRYKKCVICSALVDSERVDIAPTPTPKPTPTPTPKPTQKPIPTQKPTPTPTPTPTLTPAAMPFVDVTAADYFYEPVLWASRHNVTGGTSATTFSPNKVCTRAEVVTMLWRAAGSPTPASYKHPFVDVATDAYYRIPVLWAVEMGITAGTSDTTFSPDTLCTRAQVMTMLWRANGSPTTEVIRNTFMDVVSVHYFYQPVLWAVEHGITGGTGPSAFSPDAPCTRGQIVTFLYKAN